MEKVIVVGSQSDFHQRMESLLKLRYELSHAYNEVDAQAMLEIETFDLCILKKDLENGGSINLCLSARNNERLFTMPILFYGDESSTHERVMAFSVGANDYIHTDCAAVELCAIVTANIQFMKAQKQRKKSADFGPFSLDLESQNVVINHDNVNTPLELTRIEFKIFVFLFTNEGKLRTREQIKDSIWGKNVFVDSRTIDKHVSTLRRKISPYEKCIHTTPGLGYALLGPKDVRLDQQDPLSA